MTPDNARIFCVENDADWLATMTEILKESGHQVVLSAQTLKQALELVPQLVQLGIEVATVDGNLSEWDASGRDGRTLARAIKEAAPHVIIIGMSVNKVAGVDVEVGKVNLVDLPEIISKL